MSRSRSTSAHVGFGTGSARLLLEVGKQPRTLPSSEAIMWLTFPRLVRVLSPLPILIACAAGSAGAQQVITAQLLDHTKATSAYDAVRQLRPEMLRARESGSLLFFTPRRPAVAIDNTIVGGVEALRTIPVSEVAQIEYVNSWKAAKL